MIDEPTFAENLDQTFDQGMIRVGSFGLSQEEFKPLLQTLCQSRQSVFENRQLLEYMLLARRGLGCINPARRRFHNNHQLRAAAQAKLLPQRIRRAAFLTIMKNRTHSRKKLLCLVLCSLKL